MIVSLAAVLCDLKEYEDGLAAARAAVDLDPSNPAALSVAARCVRELAGVLERSPEADREALLAVRTRADDLARRAADANPEPVGDVPRRRRERVVQTRLIDAHDFRGPSPSEAGVVRDAAGEPPGSSPFAHGAAGAEVPVEPSLTWWRRLLARLSRREPG